MYLSLQTCLEALSDSILTAQEKNSQKLSRAPVEVVRREATRVYTILFSFLTSFLTDLLERGDFQSNKSTHNRFNRVKVSALVPSRF